MLSHQPIEFDKFWGKGDILGSLGGAGAYAQLIVKNSAWLRVGLFGGGFGVELWNNAEFGIELLNKKHPLFKAELRFKLDAMYTPPKALDTLVNVVASGGDIATSVLATYYLYTTYYVLRTTDYLLLATYYLLLTTYYLLLTTYYL